MISFTCIASHDVGLAIDLNTGASVQHPRHATSSIEKRLSGELFPFISDLQVSFEGFGYQLRTFDVTGSSGAYLYSMLSGRNVPELRIKCRNTRDLTGSYFRNPAYMLRASDGR